MVFEELIYSIYYRIDKSRIVFERENLGRRVEVELGRESSRRDLVMNGNRLEMKRN